MSPIFDTAQIPFIYNAMPKSPLAQTNYSFKSFLDAYTGCKKMVQYSKRNNDHEKIEAVLAKTEYGEHCLDGARQIEPDIKVYWYNFGETDFKTLMVKAVNGGADSILIIGWSNELLPFFKQRSELGYDFQVLCGSGSECLNEEVINSIDSKELENTLVFDFSDLSETEFVVKYKLKYPDATLADITAAAHGHEAVIIFAEAMKQCSEITGDCIKEKLKNVKDYPTALNSKGFKDCVLQINTEIYKFRNGNLVVVN